MRPALLAYAGALLALSACDAVWLGWLMPAQYQAWIGHLMHPAPLWPPALAFYLLYPVGIAALAVQPSQRAAQAAGRGALLGLIAYGTYDLTNQATLQGWPIALTLVDMAWGTFISALAALAGHGLVRRFGRPGAD